MITFTIVPVEGGFAVEASFSSLTRLLTQTHPTEASAFYAFARRLSLALWGTGLWDDDAWV